MAAAPSAGAHPSGTMRTNFATTGEKLLYTFSCTPEPEELELEPFEGGAPEKVHGVVHVQCVLDACGAAHHVYSTRKAHT